MRRESVATDPLAQFSSQQQVYNSLPPAPLYVDRIDHSSPPQSRALLTPALSDDENVEVMLNNFLSKCRKLPLDPSTVPANLNGLQILARSSAWRHVIELSDRVIEANEATTISVATRLRLEGLFRLKMFDDLSHEAGEILAAERFKRLQHQPVGDLIQNMNKIYAMQLLLAEVKAMTGDGEDAFHELFQLREELDGTTSSAHTSPFLTPSEWWSWRITSCIINTAIRQRLWRIALSELIGLIKSLRSRHNFNMDMNMSQMFSPSSSDLFALSNEPILSFRKLEITVLCRISRILLQIGAMKSSQLYFKQACDALKVVAEDPNATAVESSDVFSQVELTRGLMLFGQDQYEEAMEVFNCIVEKDRKKLLSSNCDIFSIFDSAPPDGPSKLWDENSVQYTFDSIVTLEESVTSAAVNNYAICALYLRRIKVAIDKLENLIKDDPLCYLTDPVVFNLCTLYDLSCSPDISVMKKVVLQKLSTKYHVDDPMLHWRSFRLN